MKKLILSIILTFSISFSFAQLSASKNFNHGKVRVGGGFGLSFGNHSYFGVNISPFVGYQLTNQLEGGMSLGYQYNKNNFSSLHLFSGGPYVNFHFLESLFARTHYEYFYGNQTLKSTNIRRNLNESALWLGGGYQSGGAVRIQAGIMYNILYQKDKSIFGTPIRPFAGISVSL